jgi:hypothetical protein
LAGYESVNPTKSLGFLFFIRNTTGVYAPVVLHRANSKYANNTNHFHIVWAMI